MQAVSLHGCSHLLLGGKLERHVSPATCTWWLEDEEGAGAHTTDISKSEPDTASEVTGDMIVHPAGKGVHAGEQQRVCANCGGTAGAGALHRSWGRQLVIQLAKMNLEALATGYVMLLWGQQLL